MGLHALERLVQVYVEPMPEVQVACKSALHLLVCLGQNQTDCCHRHAQNRRPSKLVAVVEAGEVCCTGQHSMELYMVLSTQVFHDQQA